MKTYPPLFASPEKLWPEQTPQLARQRSRRSCGIRALTSDQIPQVAERYGQGESGPMLAQAFGVSVGVIYRVLELEQIPLRS